MNSDEYRAKLVSQGYRVVSRKYRTVARIDRSDWRMVLARSHAPWDLTEGWDWANGHGREDFYRRCMSKDELVVSAEVLKGFPTSCGDTTGYISKKAKKKNREVSIMSEVKTVAALIFEEARAEALKEGRAKYVSRVKTKMKELAQAKTLVRNIEREIEDLEAQINDELS